MLLREGASELETDFENHFCSLNMGYLPFYILAHGWLVICFRGKMTFALLMTSFYNDTQGETPWYLVLGLYGKTWSAFSLCRSELRKLGNLVNLSGHRFLLFLYAKTGL